MQTFKVGDRVKCVDPEHGLVLNATYTIKDVDGEYVSVVSFLRGYFYGFRFVKLNTQFKGNTK